MLPRIFVVALLKLWKKLWFASFSDRVAVIGVNSSNSMELNDVKDNNEPWPIYGIKDAKLSSPVKIEALIDTNH